MAARLRSGPSGRLGYLYSTDDMQIAHEVRKWAIKQGDNPLMRIALCGYEGEHTLPSSWETIEWKARGGYGSQGDKDGKGRANAKKERIWFSPHCLKPTQMLFSEVVDFQGGPRMEAFGEVE